ncbi:hypothetical protein M0R45_029340 [Rubus argutus]|uniref:Eukaryotic translation initiation factor 2 subunit alpha n=1 Tax=Rubus argutus TaxID=59490 RepID=A0AAW1WA14_RUBAR
MASNTQNLECRMYEAKYPEVDSAVMIQLSRRRIRSINSLIKVGRIDPVIVFRVEEDKGYIDLSKRTLSKEDIKACEERYNKSKLVHSIMRHVAETLKVDLEELYVNIA